MLSRAYSLLHVKSVDAEQRRFTGIATSPEPDRVGDIVDSFGCQFKNPLPLLLFHDSRLPVGRVSFGAATSKGIPFDAEIPDIVEPGTLQTRANEAWQSVKYGLIGGVSIGFRALADGIEHIKGGGLKFLKTEILELSLVPVPANASASIHSIKSIDAQHLAASGTSGDDVIPSKTPVFSGTPVVRLLPTRQERTMKSLAEQIGSYKSTRDQKFQEQQGLMTKAADEGITLDAAQSEQYDGLESEVNALDLHIKRLETMQEAQKSAATPAVGSAPAAASASRSQSAPVIRVQPNEPPGIGFTRAVMCKAASFLAITKDGNMKSALDFAKERYPDNDRLHTYLKANIPAGTSTDVTWASPLVYATNLVDEFIEFLRPRTIIGQFGTNGNPSLTRVPFNIRVPRQTSGGDAYWVGQGAPKPLTKFDFDSITMGITKVAAISVITEELARLSSPSAELRVRDGLSDAVVARIDTDFIDPTQSAVSNVNPASITNGLTPMSPSGTTADAARSDVARIIKAYLDNNMDPSGLVLIMPTALGLSLSIQVNSLGQPEFPGLSMSGGRLAGLPVITSQYAANQSGAGNLVIAVNAKDILLADDGQVTVDVSREASLQMLDNPTNSSATATATTMVSMFQTNSLAIRAERFINWAKARSTAVVYMDDVNWGSIGSPS